jgi:hypothetical protein
VEYSPFSKWNIQNYLFIYLFIIGADIWLCGNQISKLPNTGFIGLGYHQGKDIVLRFILEYSSLRDFGP